MAASVKGRILGLILSWTAISSYSQTVNQQLWAEYMVNYPFANSFNLENAFTYSTLLTSPSWKEYNYTATFEWSVTQVVEPLVQLSLTYTNQVSTYNTFEVRPVIGCRFYLTPSRRIQTRLLVRFEDRFVKNMEANTWTQAYRPRVRAEMIIPITQDSYFKDNLWYAMVDFEGLFTLDEVNERFANRMRLRVGGGYRLNQSLRFEFLYMYQQSRNEITDAFESEDNVYRIRVKHYLRKSKPSRPSGSGN